MSATKKHPSPSSTAFLLLPLALLTLGYMFYLHNFHVISFSCTSFVSAFSTANGTSKTPPPADRANLNMFFGILTMPHLHERRHLLRSVYALQTHNLTAAKVDVRFIFCNSIGDAYKMHLALEITLYGDIIILDCAENLNDGKTYTYFSSLPSLLGTGHKRPYDYVVKADDDAYFRLDNLALVLKDKPRDDLYYGMEVQCDYVKSICGVHNTFMAGFGYVLSWDLVEWIAESDTARSNKKGMEDMMLAKWFNLRGRAKNRYNGVPAMYDYNVNMSEKNDYQHDFIPDTVAVHKLKDNFKWNRALEYFNVTNSLK
ncbi:beta-1,3-galactosyltransferase pvg3-like [Carex rostrata]